MSGMTGDCGNEMCGWRGLISECVEHRGIGEPIGPLCPWCREIVEPDDFKVGDAVTLLADLYEGPDEDHPGGYLAKKDDRLIIRRMSYRHHYFHVSHETRTDGLTFRVIQSEIKAL